MNTRQTVFAQLLGFVPFKHFEYLVDVLRANHWVKHFGAWSHFVCLVYAQLTRREGLRDLVACLNSQQSKLYHSGLRHRVTRSTLSEANERRSYVLFERLGGRLIEVALDLYQGHDWVLDRGYIAFAPLYRLVRRKCSFVVRAKDNLAYVVQSHLSIDTTTGIRADQLIKLTTHKAKKAYPKTLRRIEFYDQEQQRVLVYLTNRLDLPALTIALIYKRRWDIELFFKWLKQNLSVKHFFGNSENAVKSQIWIAICTYLTVLIAHKKLALKISLHTFMHLLEVNLFERISIVQMVNSVDSPQTSSSAQNQQELFL